MDASSELAKTVAGLTVLTLSGKIEWHVSVPHDGHAVRDVPAFFMRTRADDPHGPVYWAEYEGRFLRVYVRLVPFGGREETILELCDAVGNLQWRFPPVYGMDELLEAVRYKTANVPDFVKKMTDRFGLMAG